MCPFACKNTPHRKEIKTTALHMVRLLRDQGLFRYSLASLYLRASGIRMLSLPSGIAPWIRTSMAGAAKRCCEDDDDTMSLLFFPLSSRMINKIQVAVQHRTRSPRNDCFDTVYVNMQTCAK